MADYHNFGVNLAKGQAKKIHGALKKKGYNKFYCY